MRRRNNNISVLLIICLTLVGIGYAYIQSSLSINGTATVDSASWDIHFEDVSITDGSVEAIEAPVNPSGDSKTTSLTYNVNLSKPGDFYEFTVDVVNNGTIDGMIDTIASKYNGTVIGDNTLPIYLRYSATYSDGVEIKSKHLLKQNTFETIKVRIEFRDDIEASDLPSTSQTINLGFELTYRQANQDGIEVRPANYVYVVSNSNMLLKLPLSENLRSTAEEAIKDWETILGSGNTRPIYLKHVLNSDNSVKEGNVEFIVTKEMVLANEGMRVGTYTLRGQVDESSLEKKKIYETNKRVLSRAFGSDRCTEESSRFNCSADGLNAYASANGNVGARGAQNWGCYINGSDWGGSSCNN